jgi:hypothetical protein
MEEGRAMTETRVELEEIQTTRMEKLLAWLLAAFLLIGGLWIYHRLGQQQERYIPATPTAAERAAIDRHQTDLRAVYELQERMRTDDAALEHDREAYRTALEAHQPAATLGRAYRASEARLAADQRELNNAQAEATASAPAAASAERAISARSEHHNKHTRRNVFLERLLYVLLALGSAFALLDRLRRRHSRYLVVGFAAVGAATVQAIVMAGDYTTDYFDVGRSGPYLLSIAGIVLTLLALVGLQRYLAKRVPARRVRKHECPFCGFPVRENSHCEGCGRTVLAACVRCDSPRRVGTRHCGVCGAA